MGGQAAARRCTAVGIERPRFATVQSPEIKQPYRSWKEMAVHEEKAWHEGISGRRGEPRSGAEIDDGLSSAAADGTGHLARWGRAPRRQCAIAITGTIGCGDESQEADGDALPPKGKFFCRRDGHLLFYFS